MQWHRWKLRELSRYIFEIRMQENYEKSSSFNRRAINRNVLNSYGLYRLFGSLYFKFRTKWKLYIKTSKNCRTKTNNTRKSGGKLLILCHYNKLKNMNLIFVIKYIKFSFNVSLYQSVNTNINVKLNFVSFSAIKTRPFWSMHI